jgi:hypothetical protein
MCRWCDPPHTVPMPSPRRGRRAAAGEVDRHADVIGQLAARGWNDRAIALRIGAGKAAVRGVRRRHGIASLTPEAQGRRASSGRRSA